MMKKIAQVVGKGSSGKGGQREGRTLLHHSLVATNSPTIAQTRPSANTCARGLIRWIRVNDPSAGSPTETLLRLLLPLNDQV